MRGKITWQQASFDVENAYYEHAAGGSLTEIAFWNKCGPETLYRVMNEWAKDHNKPELPRKIGKYGVIEDPNIVDRGKVGALWKGHWPIKEIAADCNCTEDCVRKVLRGI